MSFSILLFADQFIFLFQVKFFAAVNIFVGIMFVVQLIMVAVIVGTFDNYTQAKAKCRVTMNDCNCDRLLKYYQGRRI